MIQTEKWPVAQATSRISREIPGFYYLYFCLCLFTQRPYAPIYPDPILSKEFSAHSCLFVKFVSRGPAWQAGQKPASRYNPCRDFFENLFAQGAAGVWFRHDYSCSVVRRFRYVFDPLCLLCCLLYAANRWLIKPHCHIVFFHSWFNDTLLIPCALPPLLLMQRWLGLREHDRFPTAGEVSAHVIGWSILFEWIGPHILPTTGDPWDAFSYAVGGLVAFGWWQWIQARPESASANFDWLAPHYRWMEWILAGPKLQRCRAAFLHSVPAPRRALIVGPGSGRFVVELLRQHPQARCTCVDSSRRMLDVTKARVAAHGLDPNRAEFIHADILQCPLPEAAYDLVVTHFVLDCFRSEQLAQLLPLLARAATPDARWLLSDFHEPAGGPARWRARAILEMMYLFFRWAVALPASELTAPDAMLAQCGFKLRERRLFEWGLLHSDLWVGENAG
jgi:ubiquinone/menaquinone biosynthesis C-methylase UbiE